MQEHGLRYFPSCLLILLNWGGGIYNFCLQQADNSYILKLFVSSWSTGLEGSVDQVQETFSSFHFRQTSRLQFSEHILTILCISFTFTLYHTSSFIFGHQGPAVTLPSHKQRHQLTSGITLHRSRAKYSMIWL